MQDAADPNIIQNQNAGGKHRNGKELWNTVKKKPVTLSQKNRALEDAVKVLQQRLRENDLDTNVDGEDPIPPDEEMIKLRNQVTSLQEQCNAAEQHKRAAAIFEKQARDTRAELEKWKNGKEDFLQQLTLKDAEIQLSADAGALARRDLQAKTAESASKDINIQEHQQARKEAERALAEARVAIELLKKQLAELREQLIKEEEANKSLKEQTERLNAHVSQLETANNILTDKENQENQENQLVEQKKQIEEEEKKRKVMEEEKERLEARVAAQEREISRLLEMEKQLAAAIQLHEVTVASLEERTKEVSDLTEKNMALTTINEKIKVELEEKIELVKNKSDVVVKQEIEMKRLQESLAASEKRLLKVETERKTMLDTNARQKKEMEELTRHLEETKKSMEKEKEITKQEKETLEMQRLSLQAKIAELEKEIMAKDGDAEGERQSMVEDLQKRLEESIARSTKAEKEHIEAIELIKRKEAEVLELMDRTKKQELELVVSKTEISSLETKLHASEEQRNVVEESFRTLKTEHEELVSRMKELKEMNGGVMEESSAKHKAAASLRRLAKSLQEQLDEMTTSHAHLLNELDRERTNLSCAEEERDVLQERVTVLEKEMVKLEQAFKESEKSKESEKAKSKMVTMLEETIETLSNQLGSLVDSGEAFESNAQKREDNLMQQIQVLRRGRKKDRVAYKTAVDSSNAWRVRAESAESMLVNSKLESHNKLNGGGSGGGGSSVPTSARSTNSKGERRGSKSGKSSSGVGTDGGGGGGRRVSGRASGDNGGGVRRGKSGGSKSDGSKSGGSKSGTSRGVRPTPPTNNDYKDATNQMSGGGQRRNRKVVASHGNTTLPPVTSASPTPLRAGPA